jgi:hypothetical protein
MPLYKFTITLRDQVKPITGVREIATHDIDTVYRTYKLKAETQYSEYRILKFDAVMISKLSEEGKSFLTQKRKPLL